MTPAAALADAIAHCGGATELSRKLGISVQAVGQWKHCPSRRVLAVEAACYARITRHQLRPDLYPDERGRKGRAA